MRNPTDPAAAQALAVAVDASSRTPRARLRVDWSGTGGFDHPLSDLSTVAGEITVERQISGDLPEECTLIEGYTTATLSTTLAGQRPSDPRDIARMLSPYRTDATLTDQQLVDADITCDLGLLTATGRELLRQFTGSTRTLTLSSSNRAVEVSALDPAEKLRASITLPPVAQPEEEAYNSTEWPYQARINTQWVVDYVLRRNGIYSSPPPRTGCLFAVTGHGGLIADVAAEAALGFGQATDATAPAFIAGPFGMLAANGAATLSASLSGLATGPFVPGTTDMAYLFEFWCKAGASNTFAQSRDGQILQIGSQYEKQTGVTYQVGISTAGQLWSKFYSDTSLVTTINGPKLTGGAAWHQVGVWVRYRPSAKTIETRWLLDGVVGTVTTTTVTIASLTTKEVASVTVTTPVPVACLQISNAAQPPADWGATWTPQADIDVGLNWMTGLPDIVNADSFDVLKQAVGAEFGVVSFSEDGRFRFLNRETVRTLASRAPVADLAAARELEELTLSTSLDSVRNEITMSVTPRLRPWLWTNVYEAATVDELATPTGTSTRVVTLQKRATVGTIVLSTMTAATYRDATYGYNDACRAYRADTEDEITSNLTISGIAIGGDQVRLTFVNNSGGPIRYGLDSRTPAFRLVGHPISNAPTQTYRATDATSISRYGRRTLAVPDNPFRQTLASAQAIASSLLADLAKPTTVLKDITVVGDPRLQLLDPVTVTDPAGLGGPITAVVIGTRRSLNTSDGLTDQLTLRIRR
ncbi:hypothetical protein [Amycolatopsis sp. MtRt-6]|uniref:hypothetical protein n=1 Tax=Amycolatopsis sp. MtRt-6 TaxID=2792782 RepID=UPI001A8DC3F5|nr:hypothetical protein [Amycolatopsis sp. MtRt-6]